MPSLIPDTQRRLADVFLPNWKRGYPAALDVCVISTMQQLTIQGAATIQGHALLVGEERKLAAHVDACRALGISFIPLVGNTLGGWSDAAAVTISNIGRFLGQCLWDPSCRVN